MPIYPPRNPLLEATKLADSAAGSPVQVPAADAAVNPNPWTLNSFAVGNVGPTATANGWTFTKATNGKMLWYMYNPTYNAALPWTPSGPRKRDLRSVWAEIMLPASLNAGGQLFFSVYTYISGTNYAKRYNYELPAGTILAPGCWYVIYALDEVKTTTLGTNSATSFQASMPPAQKGNGMKAPMNIADNNALLACSATRYAVPGSTTVPVVPVDGTQDEHVLGIAISNNSATTYPDGTVFNVRRFGWSRGDDAMTQYDLV